MRAELFNCYAFMKLFKTLDVDSMAKMPEIRFQLIVECIREDPEFKPVKGTGDTKFIG